MTETTVSIRHLINFFSTLLIIIVTAALLDRKLSLPFCNLAQQHSGYSITQSFIQLFHQCIKIPIKQMKKQFKHLLCEETKIH